MLLVVTSDTIYPKSPSAKHMGPRCRRPSRAGTGCDKCAEVGNSGCERAAQLPSKDGKAVALREAFGLVDDQGLLQRQATERGHEGHGISRRLGDTHRRMRPDHEGCIAKQSYVIAHHARALVIEDALDGRGWLGRHREG